MTSAPGVTTDLHRELGLLDATMINVGTMIASAIFIVPATVAALIPGSGAMVLVWVLGGLVSLLGALSVAELSAAYPEAGGQLPYLQAAYGPLWGFLYGWANFLVINPAAIAAIGVGFASYLGFFVPLSSLAIQAVAIASICGLTLLNCLDVRLGATTQNVLTFLKMIAITVLILGAFVLPGGNGANFRPLWPSVPLRQVIGPFGLAMMSVLWAYDGWIETTFVGSEIKNPGRNLPRAIILSTFIVIAFYVSVSLAFSYVLTPLRMGASSLVASDAAQVTMGAAGAAVVAGAIMLSTLGANNGIILTAARIPYAMARQGLFFRSQGWVHPRFATPTVALFTQGVISIGLALAGNYNQLATYVVFAQVLFYGLSATAVVKLRQSAPDLPRPYRTWGYPITPLLFAACVVWLLANTVVQAPKDSAVGAGLILLGLPGYWYWRHNQRRGGGR